MQGKKVLLVDADPQGDLTTCLGWQEDVYKRQELGSRFRKYFIAPRGSVLLDADYSQIELRVLAHLSGDEALQQAFLPVSYTHLDVYKRQPRTAFHTK